MTGQSPGHRRGRGSRRHAASRAPVRAHRWRWRRCRRSGRPWWCRPCGPAGPVRRRCAASTARNSRSPPPGRCLPRGTAPAAGCRGLRATGRQSPPTTASSSTPHGASPTSSISSRACSRRPVASRTRARSPAISAAPAPYRRRTATLWSVSASISDSGVAGSAAAARGTSTQWVRNPSVSRPPSPSSGAPSGPGCPTASWWEGRRTGSCRCRCHSSGRALTGWPAGGSGATPGSTSGRGARVTVCRLMRCRRSAADSRAAVSEGCCGEASTEASSSAMAVKRPRSTGSGISPRAWAARSVSHSWAIRATLPSA
ncbi:hypothetical protein CVAR21S_01109 [Corynebacterium variabile]